MPRPALIHSLRIWPGLAWAIPLLLLLLLCWPAAQAQPLLTLDRAPSRRAAWAPMDSTGSTTRDAPPPTR